jgi:hypothetical protein
LRFPADKVWPGLRLTGQRLMAAAGQPEWFMRWIKLSAF